MNRAALPLLASLTVAALAFQFPGSGIAATGGEGQGGPLFRQHCAECHRDSGFGTRVLARRVAPGQERLEARETLDPGYVKLVVRRGLGAMPQIRRTELGDPELDAITRYLAGKGAQDGGGR